MLNAPNVLQIGGTQRGGGKTALACAVVECFAPSGVVGLKVTVLHAAEAAELPPFTLHEEDSSPAGKDTARLLASGARRVWWLRTREEALADAVEAALDQVAPGTPVVAESNRLRLALQPGVFLMVHTETEAVKPSARRVIRLADLVVNQATAAPLDALIFENGRWGLRESATAIVLAGGASRRMGRDKRWIRVGEKPMIEYVLEQLRPHFEDVLVSAAASGDLEHLPQRIVVDRGAGAGPLLGLACSLEDSRHELNFVVACDVPDVPLPLARRMLRECADFEAVVPKTDGGHVEPLLAVYRRTTAAAMRRQLRKGNYRIVDVLDRLRVRYIDLPPAGAPVNLNTPEDYEHYIRSRHDIA